MRTRIVECRNGYVTTTSLPVGELCPTPFGFSEIVAEVAPRRKPMAESDQANNAGLFPHPEGARP